MTEETAEDGARPARVPPILVLLVLAVGVALRVRVHFGERALWIDEAMLALNLVPRTLAGLLQPLDWDQGAPVGWLMLCKLGSALFGTDERGLRTPAFLASLVTLPLMLRVARRHFGAWAGLTATALYAVMPAVVYQSSEFKPYTFDALATLVLVALHLDALGSMGRRRWTGLAVAGVVAVWFSAPAVFVLAGCGGSLIVSELLARHPRRAGAWGALSAVWIAGFGAHFVFLRTLLANRNLEAYWQESAAFLPLPPTSGEDVRVLLELLFGCFRDLLRSPYVDVLDVGPRTGMVLLVAALLGALAVARRDKRMLGVLTLPLVVAALASSLRLYPLQGRLLLFAAPLLALLAGAGCGEWIEGGRRRRGAAWVLLGALLLWPLVGAADTLRSGPVREEVDDCLAHLAEHGRPEDVLYVYYGARPAYEYYARAVDRFDESTFDVLLGPPRQERHGEYEPSLRALDGRGRVWVLFSHVHVGADGDERGHHLRVLDGLGTRVRTFEAPGASLVLYDV